MPIKTFMHVAILTLCLVEVAGASPWFYKNPLKEKSQTILIGDAPNLITLNGHQELEWYSCEDDGYLCLLSGIITFSVPKPNAFVKEWVINNIHYSVIGTEELILLGNKIPNVLLIKASFPQEKGYYQYFLYSYERGLMAISDQSEDRGSFMVLEGSCGFGATEDCLETLKNRTYMEAR